jgi:hypothetical protein
MQRSPELEALIQELFDAMLANDVAALEHMFDPMFQTKGP